MISTPKDNKGLRFALIFISSLVVIIIITTLIANRIDHNFRQSIIEQWRNQLKSTTRVSSLNIESYFSKFSDNLLTISGNPLVQAKAISGQHDLEDTGYCCIKNLYEVHRQDVDAILLQDKHMNVILGYPERLFQNKNHMKIFKSICKDIDIQPHHVYLSDVYTNRHDKQIITISAPVFKNAEFVGLISWMISVKKITQKYLDPVMTGENSYLWMQDDLRRILAHHDSNYLGLNAWYIMKDFEITGKVAGFSGKESREFLAESNEFFNKMDTENEGSGNYIDFAHSEYSLACFQKIPLHNRFWIIVINMPYDEILEPVRKNAIKTYSLAGVVILFLSIVTLFLFRLQRSKLILVREAEYLSEIASKAEQIQEERQQKLTAQIDGQETERKRVSIEIHDGLGQFLLALKIRLEELYSEFPDSFQKQLAEIRSIFQNIMGETKRISNNLIPVSLEELGLTAALKNLCNEFNENNRIAVEFVSHGIPDTLSMKQKTYLYRITQESLNNIQKHAEASEVNVQLLGNQEQVTLLIHDDGKGFDYREKHYIKGNGLNNIRDRAEILKGKSLIESAPDQGTTITVKIPVGKNYGTDSHYTG